MESGSADLPNESSHRQVSHLIFNAPYNFIINSTGTAGKSQKTVTAVYMDMKALSHYFKQLVTLESEARVGSGSGRGSSRRGHRSGTLQPEPSVTDSSGLQQVIIYWKESS